MTAQTQTGIKWTIHDLDDLPRNEWTTYEIIDGDLFVTRAPHCKHQDIAGQIYSALNNWAIQSGNGKAFFAPGIVLSDANSFIPDVVWLSSDQYSAVVDEAGHLTGMPELVVEVLSPGAENIRRDKQAKLKLYSIQGAQEYWIADRFTKQIEVYRRQDSKLTLTMTLMNDDVLTSPLLPAFQVSVSQFF